MRSSPPKEDMQEFLLELWQRTHKTIFMITHDVEEAVFLSSRIYVLSARPGSIQREVIIDQPDQRHHVIKRQQWFFHASTSRELWAREPFQSTQHRIVLASNQPLFRGYSVYGKGQP